MLVEVRIWSSVLAFLFNVEQQMIPMNTALYPVYRLEVPVTLF